MKKANLILTGVHHDTILTLVFIIRTFAFTFRLSTLVTSYLSKLSKYFPHRKDRGMWAYLYYSASELFSHDLVHYYVQTKTANDQIYSPEQVIQPVHLYLQNLRRTLYVASRTSPRRQYS